MSINLNILFLFFIKIGRKERKVFGRKFLSKSHFGHVHFHFWTKKNGQKLSGDSANHNK